MKLAMKLCGRLVADRVALFCFFYLLIAALGVYAASFTQGAGAASCTFVAVAALFPPSYRAVRQLESQRKARSVIPALDILES